MAERFRIDVPEPVLDDLRERLGRTRWPDAVADDWDRGTAPGALRELVEHWRRGFDWPAAQERLNALDHRRAQVDGFGLHFVRTGTPGALPLLLLHGWPDSFLRFEELLPPCPTSSTWSCPASPATASPTARPGPASARTGSPTCSPA